MALPTALDLMRRGTICRGRSLRWLCDGDVLLS